MRKTFFYIHTNIVPKNGEGKNRAKQFLQKRRIVRSKNVGKKIVGKKCEKRFFIFTQISLPKNGGEKQRETIFPETQE